ncbi:MAG: hypothetical protein R3A48_13945 [Polyangiales bacterium]
MRVLLLPLMCVACSATPAATPRDASVEASVVATDTSANSPPPLDPCPLGWSQLRGGGCVPPALACDPDAGAADPTCAADGLRNAAMAPWACPTGWRRDGERECLPTLRADCPPGSGPLPDGTCTDTVACPDARFPEVPDGVDPTRALYVDASASEDGDGTQERPFRELGAAVEQVQDHGAVLVAAGRYRLLTRIDRAVHLHGVCARRVSIEAPGEPVPLTLIAVANTGSLTLSGVSFVNPYDLAVMVHGGAAHIHHVVAYEGGGMKFWIEHGRLTVEDVFFLGRPQLSVPARLVQSGGDVEVVIRRASVDEGASLLSQTSGRVTAEDCVVRQWGAEIFSGTQARFSRLSLERPAGGTALWIRGGSLLAEDLAISGNVDARDGATFVGRRVRVEDGSISSNHQGTSVELTDLIVRFNGETPRIASNCVSTAWGARTTLRRARLGPCWEAGIYAYLLGETVAEDTWIHDARPNVDGRLGVGAAAAIGGSVSLRRTLIERSTMAGIASIHLQSTILGRLPLATLLPEYGIELQRVPSRVALTDAVIRDSRRSPNSVAFGIAAASNSEVTGSRVTVLNQEGAGILATDSGFDRREFVEGLSRTAMLSEGARGLLTAVLPPNLDGPSRIDLREVYVGPIRRSPVLWDPASRELRAETTGAFGAFASFGCTLRLAQAYIDGHGVTEVGVASQGTLELTDSVVTRATGCAATRSDAVDAVLSVGSTRVRGNGRDEVCTDPGLPALRLPMSPN